MLRFIGVTLLLILIAALVLLFAAVVRTLLLKKKSTNFELSADEARIELYSRKLSEMVRFETVSHRGFPEPDKFRAFHGILEGLFPKVFESMEKTDIDGNLLMKWKGADDTLDPIILTSHLDVVPAEGEWKYPPFSGAIAEGKVWGRGSADIKCGVMAFYQACEELLEEGYVPPCDVYLGSSCTEEIGGDGAPKIADWFRQRGIRLFMLCDEGGSLVEDPVGGVPGNFAAVGIFEKGYGDLRFIARSSGGHSSTPPKGTPIPRLAQFISHVEKHDPFTVKFSPAVDAMFENLAPYCSSFLMKLVMHNLWLFRPILKKVMPMISTEAAAMLKTTVAFTMQKGSEGYNVLPQEAWVTANLRYIPHQGMEESNALMAGIAKKYGLETEIVTAGNPSRELDLKGEPFRMTRDAIAKVFPGVGVMPYVVTGGTDSRFYDGVCDSCVRFSPVNYGPEQLAAMHAVNENVVAACLPMAVDYYKEIIRIQEERLQK
ncbi:MAG: M20/M25/M40 family metallo-hydrolase [Eubacteriaceae bacterium]|nr:M20/M25/M40 family metallo-hydrolase [Eubacteriaceae bacterium]